MVPSVYYSSSHNTSSSSSQLRLGHKTKHWWSSFTYCFLKKTFLPWRIGQKRSKARKKCLCSAWFSSSSLSCFWAGSDSLAATRFARQGQSCRRAKVQTDGLCHLTLILPMVIRKSLPPKIPHDWNAHLDEKSHCRWAFLLSLFVPIEVSSQKDCIALMRYPWQQYKRQENDCGPVLGKIYE